MKGRGGSESRLSAGIWQEVGSGDGWGRGGVRKVLARVTVNIGGMPSQFMKYSVPSVLVAGLAALALSACGSSSDSSGATELAKYAPADTTVYVEGAVQPDSEVAANIDSISDTLAGVNIGDLIKENIDSSSDGDVNFDADVKPWLGQDAGVFVQFDPAALTDSVPGADGLTSLTSETTDFTTGEPSTMDYGDADAQTFGLVVQTTDTDAAQSFIDKQAESDGGSTDGEYEGFSYKVSKDDGTTVGIVDDNLVIGSDYGHPGDVAFEDTTMPVGEETTWVFRVAFGDEAHAAHVPHGSPVGRLSVAARQLSALPTMRASVVLPQPRGPQNRNA